MDKGVTTEAFLFGAFRLDRRAGALFRRDERGAAVPVAIGSRGFAVLDMLVARHGELVSKNEIMRAVWPETVVEDNNLTVQITALRRVLDQGRAGGSCIQTIPGRGYRFVAEVTHPGTESSVALSVRPEAEVGVPALTKPIAMLRRWNSILVGISAALIALVIAAGAWWPSPTIRLSPAAKSTPLPLAAPRLSIVVLPFANFSNDPDQQILPTGSPTI